MDNKKCYLCGGTELLRRPGSVRDNPRLRIMECASCGLVFLSSFSHIAGDFYKDSNMHPGKTQDINDWILKTERDDARRYGYLKGVLPGRSLLDFGCGTGNFLCKAARLAKKSAGVEPEARLAPHFDRLGLKVYRDLSDISRGEKFDFITLFHVLEHLPDPAVVLRGLRRLLSRRGQIIVEVPNADDALLTLYGCDAFARFTYWSCHLFLFNNKTLAKLASRLKFKINYIRQVQRYPLSNHLFWLGRGKPGGQEKWGCIDSKELNSAYERQLGALGKCDTILISLSL